jgi:hypothetical protein
MQVQWQKEIAHCTLSHSEGVCFQSKIRSYYTGSDLQRSINGHMKRKKARQLAAVCKLFLKCENVLLVV